MTRQLFGPRRSTAMTSAGSDAASRAGNRSALEDERDFCLRSLRDLDAERAAGDIDAQDYTALKARYTLRAAAAIRALAGEPLGPPAGDGDPAGPAAGRDRFAGGTAPEGRASRGLSRFRRRWRRAMAVAAAAALAAVAAWAVVASSATRLPGQPISGQALGGEATARVLLEAQQAADRGNDLAAVKDYQKILDADPRQPAALTGEGWILAQTQQPSLVDRGLGMLASAESADPGYAPAHLYRGIALLSEGDYAGAVPELRWYLQHQPDPSLVSRVRQALQQAQAKAATGSPGAPTTG